MKIRQYPTRSRNKFITLPPYQDQEYLKDFQTKFYLVPIDKARTFLSLVKNGSRLLDEIRLHGTRSDTCKLVKNKRKKELMVTLLFPAYLT